jgi:hypothetical protein
MRLDLFDIYNMGRPFPLISPGLTEADVDGPG